MTQKTPARNGALLQQPPPLWAPAHEVAEDRRMHRRTAVEDITVQIRLGRAQADVAPLSGRLLNLSAGGCGVAVASEAVTETVAAHLSAGRACRIGLPVAAMGLTYYAVVVLRVGGYQGEQPEFTVRLRFGRNTPAHQQRLRRWLLQL